MLREGAPNAAASSRASIRGAFTRFSSGAPARTIRRPMDPRTPRQPLVDGKVVHPRAYRLRRFLNWFPLGLAYALLYMGRYNLTVAQGDLGSLLTKEAFGDVFAVGTFIYGFAFILNGPLTDRIGGRKAMLISVLGAAGANLGIGLYLRGAVLGGGATAESVKMLLSVLYGINMYFQSFGAVAIVKVNSSWFHVRERGGFSGIFGVMISSGIFFAFEGNRWFLNLLKGSGAGAAAGPVPTWIVFFVPAAALTAILVFEFLFLRDHPSEAGHSDIDTGEAILSPDQDHFSTGQLLLRVLTHPVILTVALIEFCTGVLRQGIMHWYFIYAGEQAKALGAAAAGTGWQFTRDWWGLIQFVAGIIGANAAGWVSDMFFQSRRAPAAGLLYGLLLVCVGAMCFALTDSWLLCGLSFLNILAVIGIHGLLSGTATMDFGGRKGTATAVGVIDGFVYLGTGVQSLALGRITSSKDFGWSYWPVFLLPFAVIGLALLVRIWKAVPRGKKAAH